MNLFLNISLSLSTRRNLRYKLYPHGILFCNLFDPQSSTDFKKTNTKTQKTNAQILLQFTYQKAVYLFSQTHVLWVNIIERAT